MATIGRGWGDSDVCSINVSNQLEFSDDGLLYNTYMYITSLQSATIEMDATYQGDRISIVAYYNNDVYLEYELAPTYLALLYVDENSRTTLSSSTFDELDGISAPEVDDSVVLGLTVSGNTVICTYGAGATVVFSTTQTALTEGYLGLAASAAELIDSYSVSTNNFADWTTSFEDDAIAVLQNNELTIENNSAAFSYIYQDITLTAGEDYTISLSSLGDVDVKIVEQLIPSNIIDSDSFSDTEITRNVLTFNTGINTDIRITIGVPAGGTGKFYEPMLEHAPYATSYTPSTRTASMLSFPVQSLDTDNGGIGMWFNPQYAYTTETVYIMYIDDAFKLEYDNGDFIFTYGN